MFGNSGICVRWMYWILKSQVLAATTADKIEKSVSDCLLPEFPCTTTSTLKNVISGDTIEEDQKVEGGVTPLI